MTFDEAIQEFELDCKIRHLSPKTIDNYKKQLRYFERFLGSEFSVSSIKDVKPSHIKSFLSTMDDAGRKPQYINDLLKVYKTFFNYLESEGHIASSPAKRIKNMKLPKLKLRTFTEKNIMDMINYYNGRSFIEIRNRAMIAMLFDTGVRLSELMELVETQIHEESIMIYGKGAKERVVPVSPFLAKALLRYSRARVSFFHDVLHDNEFFLSRTGKKLTAEAVAKILDLHYARSMRIQAAMLLETHSSIKYSYRRNAPWRRVHFAPLGERIKRRKSLILQGLSWVG